MLLAHAFGFEELVDLRVGKGSIATERPARQRGAQFEAARLVGRIRAICGTVRGPISARALPLTDRKFADSSVAGEGRSAAEEPMVVDSPLEGAGFELPVPVRQAKLTRFCR
jgi:hypothetical protein